MTTEREDFIIREMQNISEQLSTMRAHGRMYSGRWEFAPSDELMGYALGYAHDKLAGEWHDIRSAKEAQP